MSDTILPTIGRIVHFFAEAKPKPMAAIITDVLEDGKISVSVFNPYESTVEFFSGVEQGQGNGQWDWMPFQKDQQARIAKDEDTAEKKEADGADQANIGQSEAGGVGAAA